MSTDLQHAAPATLEAAPLSASGATASAATNDSANADFSEDPGLVMTSCANCGAQMLDRKCKLICSCGYFLSCSDYY
jgi:exosome complex RNA-binding protein Csl4